MARKIKRGFFTKRFYCGNCNKRVDESDVVCQNCGEPLEEAFPRKKKAKQQKKVAPAIAIKTPIPKPKKIIPEEELPEGEEEEVPEEEFEEGEAGQEEEIPGEESGGFEAGAEGYTPLEEIPLKKTALFLPRFRTLLWVIVAAMLLWGLFKNDSIFFVAAALVLVVIELESIRRRVGGKPMG